MMPLLRLIGFYRRWISPLLPPHCRFHPTCSAYAAEAVSTHGAARGTWLAARRLARCHPFCAGGLDPVPAPHHAPPAPPAAEAADVPEANG